MTIAKPCKIILEKCMGLKRNESCLILTDATESRMEIAEEMMIQALKITKTAKLSTFPVLERSGAEPSNSIAKTMKNNNVVILLTEKSLSHTKARKAATIAGSRIASMPGITKKMMQRAIDVDYIKLNKITVKLCDALDSAKLVRVITKKGTNIVFSIYGRKAYGRSPGIYTKKGEWGNLPDGEAFIAPIEKTAEGVYVVDASHAGVGKIKNTIKIIVKKGLATEFSGGKDAAALKKILVSVCDKLAFNLAEFGIGTNKKAKISGFILEDEKVFGTCHFALGNNFGFGGKINVPVHLDGVIKKPTIYLDNKIIMKEGILKI